MKTLIAFLASLVLLAATPYAFAQNSGQQRNPPAECAPLAEMFEAINAEAPIDTAVALKPDLAKSVLEWLATKGNQFPEYDLIVVIKHTDKRAGLALGWRNDNTAANAVICKSGLLPPALVPELNEILGRAL